MNFCLKLRCKPELSTQFCAKSIAYQEYIKKLTSSAQIKQKFNFIFRNSGKNLHIFPIFLITSLFGPEFFKICNKGTNIAKIINVCCKLWYRTAFSTPFSIQITITFVLFFTRFLTASIFSRVKAGMTSHLVVNSVYEAINTTIYSVLLIIC